MAVYSNILLCVELLDTDKNIISKARELADLHKAKLSIIHAVEHVSSYGAAYGVAIGAEIEDILLKNAKKSIKKLGKKLDIPEEQQIIKFGAARTVILEEAEKSKADLIVLGSHGRQGMRLLLGSTANAVLHGSAVDVLAVRLKN
ncbi:MAG: universal stress protein [Gammaproteobacteria bacterium]|nr:universal stress protein [Gammaproteobacteria bacterium]